MECRLASSPDAWACQVLIRWEFDKNGRPLEKVVEEPFGPPLKNKAEVEVVLRRAQAAVLNPKTPAAKFVHMSLEMIRNLTNELAFSRNAVCMDISGPELTDLAFVDLPGECLLVACVCSLLRASKVSYKTPPRKLFSSLKTS